VHIGVAGHFSPGKMFALDLPGSFDTRLHHTLDFSPSRLSLSFSYSTRGTEMWISMRSSSGPLILLRYRWIIDGEQRHSRLGSP